MGRRWSRPSRWLPRLLGLRRAAPRSPSSRTDLGALPPCCVDQVLVGARRLAAILLVEECLARSAGAGSRRSGRKGRRSWRSRGTLAVSSPGSRTVTATPAPKPLGVFLHLVHRIAHQPGTPAAPVESGCIEPGEPRPACSALTVPGETHHFGVGVFAANDRRGSPGRALGNASPLLQYDHAATIAWRSGSRWRTR